MNYRYHGIMHSIQQIVFLFGLLGIVTGCATPVGVTPVRESAVYEQIGESALTSNRYSSNSTVVLHRYGLKERDFRRHPKEFIEKLHEIACGDDRRDLLLALAELCFLAGMDRKDRGFYAASSVYAYLYILGPGETPPPGPFDRRFRMACDLYNRSLANVITFSKGKVDFTEKDFRLPGGYIHLSLGTVDLPWDPEQVDKVLSADSYRIRGLSIRNRTPGLGAPIIAVRKKTSGMPVAPATGATLFLEIHGSLQDMCSDTLTGELHIISNLSGQEIAIEHQKIPLEMDLSAPIAYSLNDPILWKMGRNLFRFGRCLYEPGLYTAQPYKPGLIPIILVHGTMSSPLGWAEMLNILQSDPVIQGHFQIWFYLYDSGKPVIFSVVHLRGCIEKKIREFDPSGQDSALRNAVAIGHSQGGLLIRMTAVDTGDILVRTVTGNSLEQLELSKEDRELVIQYGVFKPLPEVRRVVFISTPHRGSILAGSLARSLAARLISLPRDVFQTGLSLVSIMDRFTVQGKMKRSLSRTSIDSMAPGNPVLLALAELPFPDNVKAHSIIAIRGNDTPPEGDDGVVAYTSAHLSGVESELVVPFDHSCQNEPIVIEEVRRILHEHLKEAQLISKTH